jgi:hypothetical protein
MDILKFVNMQVLDRLGMKVRYSNLQHHRRRRKFSYFGEEEIIQELAREIPSIQRWYVDIGAMDGFFSSNTAGLAVDGWAGVCFEYAARSAFAHLASLYQDLPKVLLCNVKITPDNICAFLQAYGVPKDFGVLSLDIDSYDFFVLGSLLAHYRPSIIVAEINEKIPPPVAFTVKYSPEWDSRDSKGIFFGQSLEKLMELAALHDYTLDRLEYNNAFLVPRERSPRSGQSAREAYNLGYAQRPDRARRFPYNAEFDPLMQQEPEAVLKWLKMRFAEFDGHFELYVRR